MTSEESTERVREDAISSMEEQLSLLFRRSRAIGNRVARRVHPDMEPGAYGLLRALQRHGSLRLTDLAAEIGVGKPTVSRQVAMLESLGVVEKKSDPRDGRAQAISLTGDGSAQLAAAQSARRTVFHGLLEDWDDADLTQLSGLLERLNEAYQRDDAF
ncbi:MarR family winged helix-turn-helix transcriptional regulator [Zhihengliuella flava]|uniref:DNA-binding MarR family transcriptional regulator n=1 Tax=Zhihengliuella flava TaxID=1285193 RepID=A0A931DBN3_9MICC|nr:MarR family transcriptional regulator [Zhihengliuella flava]MBG6083775.1 DNA-binding MarR family transcriptional regulator [Zhihengliuella flava]